MRRKWLAIGIILLFIGVTIAPSMAQDTEKQSSRGNWLYVGGSGSGNYTKIQDAIDNASDGDTIFVFSGLYRENVVVNKQLHLEGIQSNESTPVVFGGDDGSPMAIYNDSCVIENFSLYNGDGGGLQSAVLIYSDFNMIKNCYLYHTGTCVYFRGGSNNIITNNDMTGLGWKGIRLRDCHDNRIANNSIHDFLEEAMDFDNASSNRINGNIFNNSRGIEVDGSSVKNIFENNSMMNLQYGLHLISAPDTVVKGNAIDAGLLVAGSKDNLLSYTISENTNHGKPLLYYKNLDSVSVPSETGQIFLVNCSHFLIQNNNDRDGRLFLYFSSNNTIKENTAFDLIHLTFCADTIISMNSLEDGGGGIVVDSSNRTWITQNTIANQNEGIAIAYGASNLVEGNHIYNNNHGIVIKEKANVRISSNTIENSRDSGIMLFRAGVVTIDNNTLRNGKIGVEIDYSTGNLETNTIQNFSYGVCISGSYSNTLSNNTIDHNKNIGIELSGTRTCTISNNIIDASVTGILLSSSTQDEIFSNQIQNNIVGIDASDTTGVHISKNNFLKNIRDAKFNYVLLNAPTNRWQNNYWGPLSPKHVILYGKVHIDIPLPSWPYYDTWTISLPWIVLDWNPAQEPYDIPGES
jgi:nitrous oxidase accessory protein